jgi:hypothetical protein
MRLRLAAALLLLGALRAAAQDGPGAFAPSLPDGVDDVSRWQLVRGDFDTPKARGEYRFYVNPARPAMYQLMRYRVELLAATTEEERRRGPAERVAFVRRPGVREPMVFWERGAAGATPAWREILAGTDEYRMEIGVLMRVLGVHRASPTTEVP